MRTITIPQQVIDAATGQPKGAHLEFTVHVLWPELRLTEEQILSNACAQAAGLPEPYPDYSMFNVRVPYASRKVHA